jgi:hypothetical protein
MGQLGYFDAERRVARCRRQGDPLETIAGLVPWESFRADIEAVVPTPEEAKKSKAGRKPLDGRTPECLVRQFDLVCAVFNAMMRHLKIWWGDDWRSSCRFC